MSYGYGFQVALIKATTPPRVATVAFTEPGTPAAANGIARGADPDRRRRRSRQRQRHVDAERRPVPDRRRRAHLRGLDLGGSTTSRTVTLNAQAITATPVQNVKTLPAPNQSVGYMLFNDHIATAEAQLVAAINQLKAAA